MSCVACFGQRNVSRLEAGDVLEWLVLTRCAFAITVRKTRHGWPLIQEGGETRDTDPDHLQSGAKSGRAPLDQPVYHPADLQLCE